MHLFPQEVPERFWLADRRLSDASVESNAHRLAPIIPTETGIFTVDRLWCKCGCRPEHLLQFAKMGSVYMENVVGIKNPRVAIVNIGAEEEKGKCPGKRNISIVKRM